MDFAAENGIRLFDTAESYGDGDSERIIGTWLRSRGAAREIALTTKASNGFTRAAITESAERSRYRLGVERIPVYLLHRFPDTPLEEALEALTGLVEAGTVWIAGCSNFSAEQVRGALRISRTRRLVQPAVVQSIYNIVCRGIEVELLPLCARHGIGVITYSPLGAGFLTGKYPNASASAVPGSRFDVAPGHREIYFQPEKFRVLSQLRGRASEWGMPVHHLALGWALRRTDIACTLIGARSAAHVRNALQALQAPLRQEWVLYMDALGTAEQHSTNPSSRETL
jgi:aryl-alcohol dehydrogenase-like predicted oxidoreductase